MYSYNNTAKYICQENSTLNTLIASLSAPSVSYSSTSDIHNSLYLNRHIAFYNYSYQLYCKRNIIPAPSIFHKTKPCPLRFFLTSFRNTFNSPISYPIYRNYLYLILSLISQTALSARSNPPPKPPIIFKFLRCNPLSAEKI